MFLINGSKCSLITVWMFCSIRISSSCKQNWCVCACEDLTVTRWSKKREKYVIFFMVELFYPIVRNNVKLVLHSFLWLLYTLSKVMLVFSRGVKQSCSLYVQLKWQSYLCPYSEKDPPLVLNKKINKLPIINTMKKTAKLCQNKKPLY